jgi:hypothetical protein
LRLDTQRISALQEVAMLISRLARGSDAEIHLASREGFVLRPGLLDVVMTAGQPRRLDVVTESSGRLLRWTQEAERWGWACDLLDGLLIEAKAGQAGHQYLSDDASGVTVEVAFAE